METEIREIKKNIMGTISFWMKTASMRKFQEFIVYPKHKGDDDNNIIIQSDNRIGILDMVKNCGKLTKAQTGHPYFVHLQISPCELLRFKDTELKSLKLAIINTVGESVGSSVIKIDNSEALSVL